ncbi:hypothetical protein LXL04_035148 [Taraxacum kok-saghyz]
MRLIVGLSNGTVLIVTGDSDRLVPSWNAVRLSQAIPGSHLEGITRSLNGAPSRSPLWSAHEEQTHRSLGNPRTTGVKPGCIASSWDRTPDLPKEAKVDTHLIWKQSRDGALLLGVALEIDDDFRHKPRLVDQRLYKQSIDCNPNVTRFNPLILETSIKTG